MADSLFDPSRIYEALKGAGALPAWVQRSPFADANGTYEAGTNTLVARVPNPKEKEDRAKSTLSHELTHTAQFKLLYATAEKLAAKKYKDPKSLTTQEEQFLDSMQKLSGEHIGPMGLYKRPEVEKRKQQFNTSVEGLYGAKKSDFDSYRTSPLELQAFGVGNMTEGGSRSGAYKPHLDPTYATEFDILLSMYEKLPKDSRSTYTQPTSKSKDIQTWDTVVDMNEDPFKPTIK